MKKIIKISLLVILIIFAFGITTSNAGKVSDDTTGSEMLGWLENGDEVRVPGLEAMKKNPYLYCTNMGTTLGNNSFYKDYRESTSYPEGDPTWGHFLAYVFAAPGYTGKERHGAWYGPKDSRFK